MSLMETLLDLNLLAVVLAALAHMATGLVWFNGRVFGHAWARLTGQELTPARRWLPVAAIGPLVIAAALGTIVSLAGATTALEGFGVAALVWLGFVVTLEIGELVWEKIPVGLFAIRVGNHLLALGLAGVILAVWR